ncbi:MAG: 2-succinyl-5-enolpyruvyl-6-hydroxy-3-cyclohexene-1-carboxylic-acid synthase, partial [candidate division Zixibacteria bacterium]|nr:2-succinyl-5-enolpyruvyl-6-hydroxy-3-cyclohexene-1-carboxylic-acid synthase [candidate division Zixibacteria bacterium]
MAGTGAKDGNHDESFSEEQMLTGSHINHLWPKLMIEELVRCGATNFCISSGSRSAPLVLAAAENENVDSIIHTDERAAAFYAVGYAKASGNPAVLICTSGTALANYYPAIVEASFSGTPLLVLSSDRPVELRDSSAPQTIDQVKIFGSYLRWFFDLHSPDIVINPAFLLTTIDQAVYRARRTPPGPVQINCQFREPLAPPDGEQDFSEYLAPVKHWLDGKKPYTKYLPPETRPADDDLLEIAERIQSATKGMIVVGLLPVGSEKKSIIRLANRLGWPLLADIASGLRFAGIKASNVLCHYDLYLRVADFREKYRPDLILHFGGLPTAKSLCQYIEQSKAEYIVINNHPYRQDPSHLVTQRIEAEPAKLADDLFVKVQKGDSPLSEPFAVAERAAAAIVAELITGSDEISE